MDTKHTPGPWRADFLYLGDIPENARVCIHAAPRSDQHSGTKVADAAFNAHEDNGYHVFDRSEAEANARLIAAAPELLAACELFAAYDDGDPDDFADFVRAYADAIKATRAAIAKAGGSAA